MSRMLPVLAVLGVVGPTTALAQTEYCFRPDEPYMPTGAAAEPHEMESTEFDVDQYVAQMHEYMACLEYESASAAAELDDVIFNWNIEVESFNARGQ